MHRGYCRVLWVLWVLHGVKVAVGSCSSTFGYWGYCRVLGTVGTAGMYCRVYRKLELRVLYATLTGIETGFEITVNL